jgi:hypothetical protein
MRPRDRELEVATAMAPSVNGVDTEALPARPKVRLG